MKYCLSRDVNWAYERYSEPDRGLLLRQEIVWQKQIFDAFLNRLKEKDPMAEIDDITLGCCYINTTADQDTMNTLKSNKFRSVTTVEKPLNEVLNRVGSAERAA